ncbi:hypothetical protein D3C73_868580 [compost metagenome]
MYRQEIEEHFRRHRSNGIGACCMRCWAFNHTIAQLLSTGQVEVTPWAGLSLVTQLFQCIRFQVTRILVIWIGKHHFTNHLSNPTVVTLVKVGFCFLKNRIGTAHVFNKFLRCFFRR